MTKKGRLVRIGVVKNTRDGELCHRSAEADVSLQPGGQTKAVLAVI